MIKLFYCSNTGTGPRLGISVGRKYGPSVRRNRFKRLVREAFRARRNSLGKLDIIVIPVLSCGEASADAAGRDFEALALRTAAS